MKKKPAPPPPPPKRDIREMSEAEIAELEAWLIELMKEADGVVGIAVQGMALVYDLHMPVSALVTEPKNLLMRGKRH